MSENLVPINPMAYITPKDPVPQRILDAGRWFAVEVIELDFGDYTGRPNEKALIRVQFLTYLFNNGWYVDAVQGSGSGGVWESVGEQTSSTNTNNKTTSKSATETGNTSTTRSSTSSSTSSGSINKVRSGVHNESNTSSSTSSSTSSNTNNNSKSSTNNKSGSGSSTATTSLGASRGRSDSHASSSASSHASSANVYQVNAFPFTNSRGKSRSNSDGSTSASTSESTNVLNRSHTSSNTSTSTSSSTSTDSNTRSRSDSHTSSNTSTSTSSSTSSHGKTNSNTSSVTESNGSSNSESENVADGSTSGSVHSSSSGPYWFAYVRLRLKRRKLQAELVMKDMVEDLTKAYNEGRKINDERYDEIVSLYSIMLGRNETEGNGFISLTADIAPLTNAVLLSMKKTIDDFHAVADNLPDDVFKNRVREINLKFDNQLSVARVTMVTNGLYNSTTWTTTEAGIERNREMALNDLIETKIDVYVKVANAGSEIGTRFADSAAKLQQMIKDRLLSPADTRNNVFKWMLDFMERRKDEFPSLDTIAGAAKQLGSGETAVSNGVEMNK